jgi:hypothetical protein
MNTIMFYHIVIRLQYNKPSSKTLSETPSFIDMFFYVLNIHCCWTTATVHVIQSLEVVASNFASQWLLCWDKRFYPQNFNDEKQI